MQTPTPLDTIAGRVRERLRDDGVTSDPAGTAAVVREEVRRFAEQALGSDTRLVDDEAATERQVLARITGFGALQPLLDDDSIEEIWINSAQPRGYTDARVALVRYSSAGAKT